MTKILVTGGTGLVGTALKTLLPEAIYVGHKECNLTSMTETDNLFIKHRPQYVIHLAAKVGGIKGNTDYIADFCMDNLLINSNVLYCSHKYEVQKVISLLSTCIYPDSQYIKYPLTEEQLHLGPPHDSNYGYAYAKRMLEVQSRAYNQQYGHNFICAIPNNIMGQNDNFDLKNGHVIPSLIRKIWEAKQNDSTIMLWGDGSPLREFTYSKDVARALMFLLWEGESEWGPVNIGNTIEYSIKDIADKITKILEYDSNKIIWNIKMPNGQYKKPSSNQKFRLCGFKSDYTNIDRALEETCSWFIQNYPRIRGVK